MRRVPATMSAVTRRARVSRAVNDLRVASSTAEFGLLSLEHGLPSLHGATVRLPRLIGQSRALDIILAARRVPAQEALTLGLVTTLTGDELYDILRHARDLGKNLSLAVELAGEPGCRRPAGAAGPGALRRRSRAGGAGSRLSVQIDTLIAKHERSKDEA